MPEKDSNERAPSTVALERRIADLTILYEVSRALQRTIDEERALYIILVGVTSGRGLGFNRAFMLLIDNDAKFLRGRLAIGPSSPEEAGRIWQEQRDNHQTLGEVLRSVELSNLRKDLRVNQMVDRFLIPVSDDANPLVAIMKSHEAARTSGNAFDPHGLPVDPQLVGLLGTDSFAVAPLFLAGRDLGLLIADNAITHAGIDLANLHLLQIYAQAASAAIQNTRLYRDLMEKIAAEEKVNLTLRESQQNLLRAERLSTMGRMAALLAHEIRTPLVSIGGFARRLLRSVTPDDPRREEMEIIVSEVRRLERLVDEVLGYARMARPEYKPTDINGLIHGVMITMQEEMQKNLVRTQVDLDPGLPTIETDEAQLRQALMNLVTNALEAMPSGGSLSITTGIEGDYVEIGVADTGVGIHQDHWDKLFTPFFTTKSSGTGLGLAIVSEVIENHSGSLRFESVPGQGTSFHVRLAMRPGRAGRPDPLQDSNPV